MSSRRCWAAAGYYGLAYADSQLGRIDDAIAAYQKVVADTPCDAVAHSIIGNLFEQQGKATSALDEYRKASRAGPANGIVVSIANLLNAQGKSDEAQATFRKAAGLLDAQLLTLCYRRSRGGAAFSRLACR
jgi:predicted Zn-dependent protease